jgi:bifunctional ADP-heptose synthase (sugar kinase/adenylyltransferase)
MSGPDATAPAEVLTPEAERFLEGFRTRYTADEVIDRLGALSQLRVLVIGDAIVDEYHFVQPYGMPTKAPVIAARFLDAETYAGGCFAVANHVAGFCREVHLVTCLGADDPREEFARKHLLPNVTATFFTQPGRPTTIKRRYLRRFLYQKLFEVSFFDDSPIDGDVERQLLAHLLSVIHGYDLVLAADFGHGLITRTVLEMLCAQSRFLAVNTQLNSINFGYHLVTRYHRADYVCIDEEESRMACRDRLAPLDDIVRRLSVELRCGLITVTRGHHGSLTLGAEGETAEVPVLSRQVVDTVGAGDAYLSVAAPCARLGYPPELTGFLGNAVGALAVRIVGNAQPVTPENLVRFIRAVMK